MNFRKQPVLKPQDIVVVVKVALAGDSVPGFAQMARALHMSASEVHGATKRAVLSRLLEPSSASMRVNKAALHEFLLHGVAYAFPLVEGPVARGLPTGVSAPVLHEHFAHGQSMPFVWPDTEGQARGPSVCPLYPTVPMACREDAKLYNALALVDAIRGGAAREREMAINLLAKALSS
jgi:hypothetical protein